MPACSQNSRASSDCSGTLLGAGAWHTRLRGGASLMRWSSCNSGRSLARRVGLRLFARHVIAAPRSNIFGQLPTERAHVGDDLTSLIFGDASTPCGHAVGTPFHDAG